MKIKFNICFFFIFFYRISAPFQIAAVVLISLGTFFAMIGHCYGDHKTILACGLYLLGGEFKNCYK